MPGADADLSIWDPERRVKYGAAVAQHRTDYNLFEGWDLTGFPEKVFLRGRMIVDGQNWSVVLAWDNIYIVSLLQVSFSLHACSSTSHPHVCHSAWSVHLAASATFIWLCLVYDQRIDFIHVGIPAFSPFQPADAGFLVWLAPH
jgi:hypothetical protein